MVVEDERLLAIKLPKLNVKDINHDQYTKLVTQSIKKKEPSSKAYNFFNDFTQRVRGVNQQ